MTLRVEQEAGATPPPTLLRKPALVSKPTLDVGIAKPLWGRPPTPCIIVGPRARNAHPVKRIQSRYCTSGFEPQGNETRAGKSLKPEEAFVTIP